MDFARTVLQSNVFGLIVALVLGAVGVSGRFSLRVADGFLISAWLVALLGVFLGKPVANFSLIPRVLTTMLVASAFGLACYNVSDWYHTKLHLRLRFVYPAAPALVIENPSDLVARDIKWMVVLWNMDLPDRNDPLPLPVTLFDWIKPHEESGPQGLFNNALVAPLVGPGNRLFGSASVNCPDCSRGRTYIVHIVFGQGGWVSEVEDKKAGEILIPPKFSRDRREEYFKALEAAAPASLRIPIGEH